MSIRLQLDAPAVRALIADDPEMALELKRAVVAEVVRGIALRDTSEIIELVEPAARKMLLEAAAQDHWLRLQLETAANGLMERGSGYYGSLQPTAITQKKLRDTLGPFIETEIGRISASAAQLMADTAETAAAGIEERIEARVNRLVEERIAAEVDRRVKAKLDAVFRSVKP